jgi:hypothetical protein
VNQFTASLWGDEAFSAILSMKSVPQIISIIMRDTSPPLYNLTEHFIFGVFGTSEIAIRGLSFFYYLIACFFVYRIASYIWDKKTGILASVLTFLNPFFFIYAFEGRMYSILALGVTASMYFFIKRKWIPYIVATTWALYSHHFAFFAIFVQAIWFLYESASLIGKKKSKKRKEVKAMFLAFVGVGILYLPWLIPLYNQVKMVSGGFWLGKPGFSDLLGIIGRYLAFGIQHPLSSYSLVAVIFALLVRNWREKVESSIFLVSWFILPISVTYIISQKFQSIFFDRYLLYTIPACEILVVSNRKNFFHIFLIGVILAMFAIIDFNYFTHPTKRPFKELASFVTETKRGDDFLVNWNSASHHLWETKYYGISAPIYISSDSELPYYVGTALMEKTDVIRTIPKGYYRIGVITSGNVDEVKIPGYTKDSVNTFGDLKFIWYIK